LESSVQGTQENSGDAWLWSGTLGALSAASIEISYQAASLKSAAYRVGPQNGNPAKQLRVAFHRQDLDSMRFESGDGTRSSRDETVVWERRDFLAPDYFSASIVESRNLHGALARLMEIGPLVSLLFLLAVSAVIGARQELSVLQIATIATVYALYFPLILYLSARFPFPVALVIAAIAPGALLVNYARWLLGGRAGLAGGAVFLALYWIFPTLAAFAGWNRGLVLLCLGLVTLWVLVNLQNQAMRLAARVAAVALFLALPGGLLAGEARVVLPAELAGKLPEAKREIAPPVVAFEPARYEAKQNGSFFQVEAVAPFRVLRAGEATVPLFGGPVFLSEVRVESAETNFADVATVANRLALYPRREGTGSLRVAYRAPIREKDGKHRVEIPLLAGVPANARLETVRGDITVMNGSLWTKSAADKTTVYEIGVAGEDSLIVEWREGVEPPPVSAISPATNELAAAPADSGKLAAKTKDIYGIGLRRAQNLTVINSDGSCSHFADFDLPPYQAEDFRMKLPPDARLISVSVNGNEIDSPEVRDQVCVVKLPGNRAGQDGTRLSFRIAYPPLRLGFIGSVELALPELFQTTGVMEWVVALPGNFQTRVVASGLAIQKTPPDLGRFGDFGRILQSRALAYLSKDLAPPGLVSLSLKYRQELPGILEPASTP
jgi:hypothetical protein